jgi:SAM-dependent methyltransferase
VTVHRAAAEGFTTGAAAYERSRPDYPVAAIDHLATTLALGPNTTVLDLGAGTGKLTRLLVPTGATVVAIEPVAAMREQLLASVPGVDAIDCTAESIAWPDGDADAVVAAQAFHWFDAPRALVEIHRVLRRGGGLGLVWNKRDETVPWVARLTEILDPFAQDAPRYRWESWRAAFAATTMFTDLKKSSFPYEQVLDSAGLVDRVSSISFVAIQPADVKAGILDDVRALADTLPQPFAVPHHTDVYTCTTR